MVLCKDRVGIMDELGVSSVHITLSHIRGHYMDSGTCLSTMLFVGEMPSALSLVHSILTYYDRDG